MDQKQRITAALLKVLAELDVPAFKNINPSDLRSLPLRDHLDSLGMVNLIIGMEEALREQFGHDVPILGRSEAFSTANVQTAGSFIDYLNTIV